MFKTVTVYQDGKAIKEFVCRKVEISRIGKYIRVLFTNILTDTGEFAAAEMFELSEMIHFESQGEYYLYPPSGLNRILVKITGYDKLIIGKYDQLN